MMLGLKYRSKGVKMIFGRYDCDYVTKVMVMMFLFSLLKFISR